MATAWVLGKVSDALAPTVSSTVATAGSFAGGAVNAVGSSINGVGEGINNSIRRYGDGAKDYGNSIMDWTRADAVRGQTASNPLGLSTDTAQGKRSVTSPKVYQAPARTKSAPAKPITGPKATSVPSKKIVGAPAKKTVLQPTIKANTNTSKKPVAPASSTTTGGLPKKASGQLLPVSKGVITKGPSTVTKAVGPVKSGPVAVTRTKLSGGQKPNHVAAANPLGLSS